MDLIVENQKLLNPSNQRPRLNHALPEIRHAMMQSPQRSIILLVTTDTPILWFDLNTRDTRKYGRTLSTRDTGAEVSRDFTVTVSHIMLEGLAQEREWTRMK